MKHLKHVSFAPIEVRKISDGTEMKIEVSKDQEKGVAALKIFGPNRKANTLL